MHTGDLETLVMGKHIFIIIAMFDALFNINFSSFSTSSENPWAPDLPKYLFLLINLSPYHLLLVQSFYPWESMLLSI